MIVSASEQPAARVGDQHGLVVGEDLGRLRHEVHPAEHDGGRIDLGGNPRERQGVTDVVGDVLDLGHLVVVGEDDGVAILGEGEHLLAPIGGQHLDIDGRSVTVDSVGGSGPATTTGCRRA